MRRIFSDYPNLQRNVKSFSSSFPACKNCGAGRSPSNSSWLKRKDGSRVKRGPYPLFTRKHGQKTISRRLTDPSLVPLYRRQIQAMRQFETVVDGLVRLGEQLSDLAVAEVVQKKTPGGTGTSRRGAAPRRRPGRPADA